MILDHLDNAGLYAGLSPRLARAFAFLAQPGLGDLPDGKHDIDGEAVYALVSRYVTRPFAEGCWEAHRRYLDLHYVVAGCERLGRALLAGLTPGEYDAGRDYLPLTGDGDLVTLAAGTFALIMPHDAHLPHVAAGEPGPVHKVVIKIAVA